MNFLALSRRYFSQNISQTASLLTKSPPTTFSQALSRASLNTAAFLASLTIFFQHIANFSQVEGTSMYPVLKGGDNWLVVQKLQAQNMLQAGDIVVLKSPVDPKSLLVKRLIALPGQSIPVPLEQTSPLHSTPFSAPSKPLRIPQGHVWIEGDNYDQSIDSRHFGAVPQALIQGIARLKFDTTEWSITLLETPPMYNPHNRPIVPPSSVSRSHSATSSTQPTSNSTTASQLKQQLHSHPKFPPSTPNTQQLTIPPNESTTSSQLQSIYEKRRQGHNPQTEAFLSSYDRVHRYSLQDQQQLYDKIITDINQANLALGASATSPTAQFIPTPPQPSTPHQLNAQAAPQQNGPGVRANLNPYLDAMPIHNQQITLPTVFYDSIASQQQHSQPPQQPPI